MLERFAAEDLVRVDGKTVTAMDERWFETHIIPHTWRHTSLHERKPGDPVNLETDMFGKYVQRYLASASASGSLDMDSLASAGFLAVDT